MTTEEEFEAFVRRNRETIERMMESQKKAAETFAEKEFGTAKEARALARDVAEQGKARAEEAAGRAFAALFDPEVQKHFVNMGLEFFMCLDALVKNLPVPEYVRDGYGAAESAVRDAACRSNSDCGARAAPKRVSIAVDSESRRDASEAFGRKVR